ncbi:MAG: PASTA domain-containing protein [Odoribacteraceae bacterium]|jgi:beta-lactam-binding protein with PASTA domain|nr:PASTA domain-containing protein [Odoribacteraceae bacterium]
MYRFNKKGFRFWLANVAVAIVLFLLSAWFVLRCLDNYTRHGHYILVPNLRGVAPREAARVVEEKGLHVVVIDSVYNRNLPGGVVVEQYPLPDARVKNNRVIQLTVNAKEQETLLFPELNQPSFRQALQRLRALRLQPGRVEYTPSPYANLVLGFRHGGLPVEAGTRLPVGARIDILLGDGGGEVETTVPGLTGKTLEEAVDLLLQAYLNVGEVTGDHTVRNDAERAVAYVYEQRPGAGYVTSAGRNVNLSLTRDPKKKIEEQPAPGQEGDFITEDE